MVRAKLSVEDIGCIVLMLCLLDRYRLMQCSSDSFVNRKTFGSQYLFSPS